MEMLLSTVKHADLCIELLAEFASTTFAEVSCDDTEGENRKNHLWSTSWLECRLWQSWSLKTRVHLD